MKQVTPLGLMQRAVAKGGKTGAVSRHWTTKRTEECLGACLPCFQPAANPCLLP
jgi:hypothetical protein